MKKEGRLDRRNYLYGIIITGFFGLIYVLIPMFYNKSEDKPEVIINHDVNDNSNVIDNEGVINKSNVGNNSGTIYNGNQTVNIYNSELEKEIDYSVKGSIKLLKKIKKSNIIEVNQTSVNSISISYTGQLVEIAEDSNIFIYNGGFVSLKINEEECRVFKDMKLEYIRANPKNIIESKIRNAINEYVENSFLEIRKSILECI